MWRWRCVSNDKSFSGAGWQPAPESKTKRALYFESLLWK